LGSQERYGKTCISDVLGGGTKHLFRLNVTVSNAKLRKEKRGDAGKSGIKETIKRSGRVFEGRGDWEERNVRAENKRGNWFTEEKRNKGKVEQSFL
jgi:hypothetical protein